MVRKKRGAGRDTGYKAVERENSSRATGMGGDVASHELREEELQRTVRFAALN
jgi:hypothetical protein